MAGEPSEDPQKLGALKRPALPKIKIHIFAALILGMMLLALWDSRTEFNVDPDH